MATILIGADICPIEENRPYLIRGDASTLFNDLLIEFEQADLSIANLECPLIEAATPIVKSGPVFGEESACIEGIARAGIDVIALANNHVMDHGAEGLENTVEVCSRAGVATVGAGRNLEDARRILVRTIGDLRVGILAVAEYEFSIAARDSWGANPLDLIDYVRNVNEHRDEFDYLIVLLHGSAEFLVPTPRIKDTCHFMVEMGANAVIVQHPHCVGGYEEYRGGHIVYGQGALLMDEAIYRDRRSFHEAFLVKLSIAADASSTMEIVPFEQSDPAPGARRMDAQSEDEFRRSLAAKSAAIEDDAFVRAQWLEFCEDHKHGFISALLGQNRVFRKLNISGLLTRLFYGRGELLGARNVVCCETHREAIQTIFDNRLI